jgi:hypothetical protein
VQLTNPSSIFNDCTTNTPPKKSESRPHSPTPPQTRKSDKYNGAADAPLQGSNNRLQGQSSKGQPSSKGSFSSSAADALLSTLRVSVAPPNIRPPPRVGAPQEFVQPTSSMFNRPKDVAMAPKPIIPDIQQADGSLSSPRSPTNSLVSLNIRVPAQANKTVRPSVPRASEPPLEAKEPPDDMKGHAGGQSSDQPVTQFKAEPENLSPYKLPPRSVRSNPATVTNLPSGVTSPAPRIGQLPFPRTGPPPPGRGLPHPLAKTSTNHGGVSVSDSATIATLSTEPVIQQHPQLQHPLSSKVTVGPPSLKYATLAGPGTFPQTMAGDRGSEIKAPFPPSGVRAPPPAIGPPGRGVPVGTTLPGVRGGVESGSMGHRPPGPPGRGHPPGPPGRGYPPGRPMAPGRGPI